MNRSAKAFVWSIIGMLLCLVASQVWPVTLDADLHVSDDPFSTWITVEGCRVNESVRYGPNQRLIVRADCRADLVFLEGFE